MTQTPSTPTLETTARLHDTTTLFHAFVYFAPEAAAEYSALGIEGRSGYFASRTAAMGPLSTPMVIATFYNFCPDLVTASMDGVWDRVSAAEMQAARWLGVQKVLDTHVRAGANDGGLDDAAIAEAIDLAQTTVDSLSFGGRPLAAGNAAVLDDLEGNDQLLRLWQLVTVLREWRGDGHIALLVTEPLSPCECTVMSEAMLGRPGNVKKSRAWSETDWATAEASLAERGWLDASGDITDAGRSARTEIERRTNEDSLTMLAAIGEQGAARLGELLAPAAKALLQANYFAAIGRPAK